MFCARLVHIYTDPINIVCEEKKSLAASAFTTGLFHKHSISGEIKQEREMAVTVCGCWTTQIVNSG